MNVSARAWMLLVVVAASFSAAICRADVPATWLDDASLHDVQFVGSKVGFAVGSHGVVWKTNDGGRTWSQSKTGVTSSLKSVCFLTDQTGWAAGGDVVPHAGLDVGVLLFTDNGGQTWRPLAKDQLPKIISVKFFGLEEGVVVTSPTPNSPGGLFKTTDGGAIWTPVEGEASSPWRGSSFLDHELGVVVGHAGRLSLLAGNRLVPSKLPSLGLRSIRAVSVQHSDQGWLAGDGGLVMKTKNGGVAWESQSVPMPTELRNIVDFHAIEMRGDKVWLAGSPGSLIWHSPDGGLRWERQTTGQTAPLHAIRFTNDAQGIAVGDLGVILRTEDGGRTWRAVRGGSRRAAVLAMESRPGDVSSAWIARLAGEHGYRSRVWIANRQDVGELSRPGDDEQRLTAAVEQSGGNGAEVHWQLPVAIPGLEFNAEKLQADWQRRTEGKLGSALLGSLVKQLRMWKPSVVIVDEPLADDAAGQLLHGAVLRAIEQAADGTRFIDLNQVLELPVWKVQRVYMRLAAGTTGDAIVDLDDYLPTRKTTVRLAASVGDAILRLEGTGGRRLSVAQARHAFRWIGLDGRLMQDSGHGDSTNVSRDFFAGLSLAPGTEARRALTSLDESNLEKNQKLAQKQRNFNAISQKSFDDPRLAAQMIGQIGGVVADLNAQQGAELLRGMAAEYQARSMFELVESTNVELIRRYPAEPAAVDAMRWLIQFWSSSETAWQRVRGQTNTSHVARGDGESQRAQIEQAAAVLASGRGGLIPANAEQPSPFPTGFEPKGVPAKSPPPTDAAPMTGRDTQGKLKRFEFDLEFDKSGQAKGKTKGLQGTGNATRLTSTNSVEWRTDVVRDWHSRANELARQLEVSSPAMARLPEIQFPLAAMRRNERATSQSDAIYRGFLSKGTDSATRSLAQRELWAMFSTAEQPQALSLCRRAVEKPKLDGLLSDPCWQTSHDLVLTREPLPADGASEPEATATLVMLAHDAEFLYIGLSVPRFEGQKSEPLKKSGRTHDADVLKHDRVSIFLDIDRDYTTWYELTVDQRGCTFDKCWDDHRWNPTWFVAADSDNDSWRIEAAIPWSELSPSAPGRGSMWSVAITRTNPTLGMQAWVHPANARPRPTSFGLLKFD